MKPITFYIYRNALEHNRMTLYRCVVCSRPLFKAGGELMVITNAATPLWEAIKPGSAYFEVMCHSCKTEYKVLYQ
jgi:DNA-directed RNA polymerase subunit RPC12/RpoP